MPVQNTSSPSASSGFPTEKPKNARPSSSARISRCRAQLVELELKDHLSANDGEDRLPPQKVARQRRILPLGLHLLRVDAPLALRIEHHHIRRRTDRQRS